MFQIKKFTFNGFQENTFLIYDETLESVLIDPGNNSIAEDEEILDFIHSNNLELKKVVLTHAHLDHVFGLAFIEKQFGLKALLHPGEVTVLEQAANVAKMYGVPFRGQPEAGGFLTDADQLTFGNQSLSILFTPGHSPASICFYSEENKVLIGGDVLFLQSIGRTDLPGGDFDTLISSIKNQLFVLPDDVIVYPGHGPKTTIGYEKTNNPFLQ